VFETPAIPRSSTRFAADAMLGSLSRKLRALGFDTAYYRSGEDTGLLDLCESEDRVLLTSDRPLALRATGRGLKAVLVEKGTDADRLSELRTKCEAAGIRLERSGPLCSQCGGTLSRLRREQAFGKVPPGVLSRHRAFYFCWNCGRYYWKGTHWKKLRLLGRRLNSTSNAAIRR
jgi:uncharacterized protein